MKILITGGAGFLGARLARTLLKTRPVTRLVLADLFPPPADLLADARVEARTGALLEQCAALSHERFDGVFHLASAVSSECEANFDLGMSSNLDSTRALLDGLRAAGNTPRLVFSSSVAVFGSDPALPLPAVVRDDTLPTPQSSYGVQKFICEQLVADYTRKGFIDGRSLRLPTVVARPGKPNLAASSFASSLIREPLNGEACLCPVSQDTGVWMLSPGRVVDAFIHAHELPSSAWGVNRVVNLPGITVSVRQMIEALRKVAGSAVAGRVDWRPDARIQSIVKTWPVRFRTERALALGFRADSDIESIIRDYARDQALTCLSD